MAPDQTFAGTPAATTPSCLLLFPSILPGWPPSLSLISSYCPPSLEVESPPSYEEAPRNPRFQPPHRA